MTSAFEHPIAAVGAEPALRAIDAIVSDATGHEAFPEGLWAALENSPDHCVVAIDPAHTLAAVAFPSDTFQPSHSQLGAALAPRGDEGALTDAVAAVLTRLDRFERVVAWIPGSDVRVLMALTTAGFRFDREQLQMRIQLPVGRPAELPTGIAVRGFRPGLDDAEWLRVNNRAFANHPDQGDWIEATLQRRIAEPWFESAGFLLAWRDATLMGFCWTKVHETTGDPEGPVGEIFVIGVDPDAQGSGLGRALVLAGLAHLATDRACRNGLLYVAAGNPAAVRLYEQLGFTVSRRDTALVIERDVP